MVSVARTAGVDVNTQQSFEALNARAVAVVVDPIQSVKGKVGLCQPCSHSIPGPFLTTRCATLRHLARDVRRGGVVRGLRRRGGAVRW